MNQPEDDAVTIAWIIQRAFLAIITLAAVYIVVNNPSEDTSSHLAILSACIAFFVFLGTSQRRPP